MRILGVLLVLAGCEKVFSLRAIPDAPPIDAIDAPPLCAPGIGHDEDGDCVPDVMDHCPGIADALQPDTDGDTVGDDCDPDPGSVGNTQAAFVTFEHATEQSMWTPIGSWSVAGDDYSNADVIASSEDWTYRSSTLFGTLNEVEARITVGATGDSDVKVGIGFYAPSTTGGSPTEWSCSIRRAVAMAPQVDAYANQSPSFSSSLAPATVFGEGATYTFRMTIQAGALLCDVRGDGGDVAQATAPFTAYVPGYLAAFTSAAQAKVHYMAVYTVDTVR